MLGAYLIRRSWSGSGVHDTTRASLARCCRRAACTTARFCQRGGGSLWIRGRTARQPRRALARNLSPTVTRTLDEPPQLSYASPTRSYRVMHETVLRRSGCAFGRVWPCVSRWPRRLHARRVPHSTQLVREWRARHDSRKPSSMLPTRGVHNSAFLSTGRWVTLDSRPHGATAAPRPCAQPVTDGDPGPGRASPAFLRVSDPFLPSYARNTAAPRRLRIRPSLAPRISLATSTPCSARTSFDAAGPGVARTTRLAQA